MEQLGYCVGKGLEKVKGEDRFLKPSSWETWVLSYSPGILWLSELGVIRSHKLMNSAPLHWNRRGSKCHSELSIPLSLVAKGITEQDGTILSTRKPHRKNRSASSLPTKLTVNFLETQMKVLQFTLLLTAHRLSRNNLQPWDPTSVLQVVSCGISRWDKDMTWGWATSEIHHVSKTRRVLSL